jgi:hypothetical protein
MIEAKPKKKAAAPAVFAGQSTPERDREPDLVTAIFDVLIESHPDLMALREQGEAAVRHRLKGLRGTVTDRPDSDTLARRVLALFNGRNPREVARRLGISNRSVYRVLKQAGK